MFQVMRRAVVTTIAAALAGAVSFAIVFTLNPDLSLQMDRDLPRITSGFYPAEVHRDQSFAWTGRSAVLRMSGADRRVPWTCSVRFRGGRTPPLEQPVVELAADGITLASRVATNDYQVLEVTIPPQPSRTGLVLTVASSTTFVPGPADKRELGVQVDALKCAHAPVGFVLPPRRGLIAAAAAGAAFGAGLGWILPTTATALCATIVLAIAAAIPLASGPGPYSSYVERAGPLAFWIFLAAVVVAATIERWRREPLSGTAKFVIAFSAGALFLELLAVLHPSKLVVDAVFHAHRLQWVLGGRYYFTQPMPDGVQFPYAIALYLFAIPWSSLAHDHVTLLRIIIAACHACAGALLYPMATRVWNDRFAGAVAVVLFHLVPLPFIVIGNANLTYSFGQSAAFIALAAAVLWPPQPRRPVQLAAFFLLASIPFLSHVGVFPVLLVTLITIGILYRFAGGNEVHAAAHGIVWTATLAAIFAVVTYYGQFGEVYKSLERVRGRTAVTATPTASPPAPAAAAEPAIPLSRRAATAATLALRAFGWPVVLLAAAGIWQVRRSSSRDRLTLALAGAAVTYAVFVAFAAWTPVEPRFQKYSDEFIDRMNYAAIPVAVLLAGRGASWGWRTRTWTRPERLQPAPDAKPWSAWEWGATRGVVAALLSVAVWSGIRAWLAWLG